MGLKIVVVGAGPVGALTALYAARRADVVEVYELRNDLRDPSSTPLNFTRSINLAVSERGINAIRHAQYPGLAEKILKDTIPMYGRMIHGTSKGRLFEASQKYDINGRAIMALDRSDLNTYLLDELEKLPNVKLFFNHRLTGADFKKNSAWFESRQPWRGSDKNRELRFKRAAEIEVPFDLLVGADGAHSAARFHMMKFARVSYEQEYIDTLWCEFTISAPASNDTTARKDGFQMSPNHLHIWPAGSLMFIAIPSADKTFTCTLFMSASEFDAIDSDPESLIPFFNKNFPGVASNLIPEADLKKQYAQNPHLPLISIKCSPYHYGSSVVIVGDAAHAMVPFYGQGMNAGFEDVRVLFEILDKHASPSPSAAISNHSLPPATALAASTAAPTSEDHGAAAQRRAAALAEYTTFRAPDAHVINDLAMGNLHEMRASVRSRAYLIRKRAEEWLSVWAPALGFKTQYSRVSFSNERYSDVVANVYRQHAILNAAGAALGVAVLGVGLAAWRLRRR